MAKIAHFPRSAPAGEIAARLAQDGAVIVDNLLTASQVDRLLEILAPDFDALPINTDPIFGGAKKSVVGIFHKSGELVEHLLLNRLVHEVTSLALAKGGRHYKLTVSGAGEIWGGGEAQVLHRELDVYEPFIHYDPALPEYICFTMFAASDFTADNGATRIVPGSHLWPAERDPTSARPEEIAQAEMKKGSIVMWLGKTVHGLGSNITDRPRQSFATSYVVDWLAQEENQYLLYPPEAVRGFPVEAQRLLGYRASNFLGWVRGLNSECLLEKAQPGQLSGPSGIFEEMSAARKGATG